jgi:hypothetical protein
MAAETKGRAILRIPTEDPRKPLLIISDDAGNLKTDNTDAVFLENEVTHRKCHRWSQAFSSRQAFDAYLAAHPDMRDARMVSFAQWAELHGKKPDTYIKPTGPHGPENPYKKDSL